MRYTQTAEGENTLFVDREGGNLATYCSILGPVRGGKDEGDVFRVLLSRAGQQRFG